jgi:tetratricopeptide (TPR) repeat protein
MMRKTVLSLSFSLLITLVSVGFLAQTVSAQKPKDIRRSNQLVEQGDRSLSQRNYPEAISKYAEAIAFNPKNAAARFSKGKAHSNLKQSEMALMELNAALEQGYSKPAEIYLLRYKIYYDAQDFEAAQKDVDAALVLDPQNPELLLAQGEMSFAAKRYPQALDAFQRVLQTQPNNAEVYLNVAKLHYMTNNVQSQGEAAQEAINKQTRFVRRGISAAR